METAVFIVAGIIVLVGAVGLVVADHPVYSALFLVLNLFGVAVLFLSLGANFLAAVQVIVYAGAIVVLFLFVLMLLGVDKAEDLRSEPITGQRPAAAIVSLAVLALITVAVITAVGTSGVRSGTEALTAGSPDVEAIGRSVFTDYVFAFELTSVLLVVAVVATVLLARRPPRVESTPDGQGLGSPPGPGR